jgi:phospholipid-binding lipoprotein MlaA
MLHPLSLRRLRARTLSSSRDLPTLALTTAVGLAALSPVPLNAGEEIRPVQRAQPHHPLKKGPSKNPASREKNADDADAAPTATPDPLQKINRATFGFNNVLYRFVLRPVGKVTSFILTKHGVQCLENVLENVEAPVRIVGCLFQAKFKRAGQETGKLLVNSTVGVGGLFKVSDRISGLRDVPHEDFGQAVASWGVPQGPYVVLPVIGPSTAREILGHVGDTAANPATWLGDNTVRLMTRGIKTGIENPYRMDLYDAVTSSAVDPYVAAREGYISRRHHEIAR